MRLDTDQHTSFSSLDLTGSTGQPTNACTGKAKVRQRPETARANSANILGSSSSQRSAGRKPNTSHTPWWHCRSSSSGRYLCDTSRNTARFVCPFTTCQALFPANPLRCTEPHQTPGPRTRTIPRFCCPVWPSNTPNQHAAASCAVTESGSSAKEEREGRDTHSEDRGASQKRGGAPGQVRDDSAGITPYGRSAA